MPELKLTKDSMLDGQLTLWQPAKGFGYRFNLDPILLSGFAKSEGCILDLGSGCGVLGLAMLLRGAKHLIAVEKEPAMAEVIKQNAEENGLSSRVDVICADLRELDGLTVDHVVSNPPYFKPGSGRAADNALKDAARFERSGGLYDFLHCGLHQVKDGGTVSFVIRYDRKADLLKHTEELGASVQRICEVRPHRDSIPKMIMAELMSVRGAETPSMETLTIHEEPGKRDYTETVRNLLSRIPSGVGPA
ncbi:MAG: methyltransferase [Deltaproteobacteria bacterium]|jgi:tRNA1Val (adenine37-N6)-methyltransferase|nr:methyltransferase [Deltaproteobacteria bacterium]MBT6435164.1 methyltransferase [Deltaproteobacteria bacterium]